MTQPALDIKKQPSGYVLLLSVIFLSVIAVTITGSLLLLGLARGQTGFAQQQAAQARGLAEACAETALVSLQQDASYAGGEVITLGNGSTCQILPVTFSAPDYTVDTQAAVGAAIKNIEIQTQPTIVNSSTVMQIDSWQEVP